MRTFEEWWYTIPQKIREKTRGNDAHNKPLLNQINFILVHNNLQKRSELNPSYAELMHWIKTGQIEVMRND